MFRIWLTSGHAGDIVVSVLTFYFNGLSSNPAGYLFSVVHYYGKKKNEKLVVVGPSIKSYTHYVCDKCILLTSFSACER